eukprot:sb/3477684/
MALPVYLGVTSQRRYSRTPIYRDAWGKGFCPVNRGARYIGVIYRIFCPFILPVNRGSGKLGPDKSGSDCIYIMAVEAYFDHLCLIRSERRNFYSAIVTLPPLHMLL